MKQVRLLWTLIVILVLAACQLLIFFGTALASLFVAWWNEGKSGVTTLLKGLLSWRVGLHWYGFALLVPAMLFWTSMRISAWLDTETSDGEGVNLSPCHPLIVDF